jgi:hypothetical protein
MAIKKSSNSNQMIKSHPKNTIQGCGDNTKYSATSRNKAKKKYRGQGKG